MARPAPAVPPSRDGVGASCVGLPTGAWPTITDFLVERFPAIARATWLERMDAGLVVDELGDLVTPARPYQSPLRVYYFRALPQEPRVPFDEAVLHQDDHLVVADKPHFLPVTPGGRFLQETLLVRLKRRLGLDTLVPLHRLDRETAGLVLFSANPTSRSAYAALLREQGLEKQYEAIAPCSATLQFPLSRASRIVEDEQFFRQREVAGKASALTHISVLQTGPRNALYQLCPVTGRKHQLRVHMLALGLPIVGDQFYPEARAADAEDDYRQPLQLLARSLRFTDPVTGSLREFESRRTLDLALLEP
jgi:tRNA pseudouridine32 synthase / 23S rRNA pseudouridine746 synthase